MPQVPYDPVPQVAAEDTRIRRPEVEAPPEAFGTNIGAGVQRLGEGAAQVGDETFRTALWLQNLNNESTARDMSIQATQEMTERAAAFDSLEGKARHDGLPQYLKDLNDIRLKYRSQLNPVASRFFDAEAASLQNRFTAQGAISAGNALKQYGDETADGQITLATRQPVDVWDEKEFQQNQDTIDRALESKARIKGWPQEKLDGEKLIAHGTQRFYQIKGQIDSDVHAANNTLEQAVKNKQIDEKQYDTLHEYLLTKNRSHGSEVIANSVYDPDAKLEDLEDRARKLGEDPKLNMGDDTFAEAAVKAVQLKYNQAHHAEVMDQATARHSLDIAVHSGNYRTEADIRADPKLAAALEQDPTYDPVKALKSYWTPRDFAASKAQFDKLWGEADQKPMDFLKEDLWNYQLTDQHRGKLMQMRHAIIKANGGPISDPNVDKASKAIRNIFPNSVPKSGTDDYLQWLGSLQGLMEEWQIANKAKPGLEDYEKMGRALTASQEGTGWFGGDVQASPVYNAPIAGKKGEEFRDWYQKQGMPDDEILTLYHRTIAVDKFNRLFSGGKQLGRATPEE